MNVAAAELFEGAGEGDCSRAKAGAIAETNAATAMMERARIESANLNRFIEQWEDRGHVRCATCVDEHERFTVLHLLARLF